MACQSCYLWWSKGSHCPRCGESPDPSVMGGSAPAFTLPPPSDSPDLRTAARALVEAVDPICRQAHGLPGEWLRLTANQVREIAVAARTLAAALGEG
jgi:hypothetical protein